MRALKEWQKLGDTVRQQLKKKLGEVLLNPRIRRQPSPLAAGLLQDQAAQQRLPLGVSGD